MITAGYNTIRFTFIVVFELHYLFIILLLCVSKAGRVDRVII